MNSYKDVLRKSCAMPIPPTLTQDELNYVGDIFKARSRIEELDIDSPVVDRNLKMRLMLTMAIFNKKHQGYTSETQTFVCPQAVVAKFYHNIATQVHKKASVKNTNVPFQTQSLKTINTLKAQCSSIKNRFNEGEQFASVDRKTGLTVQRSTEEINRDYYTTLAQFASTYPHNDYPDEYEHAKGVLSLTLNDPGDKDLDGNTVDPVGTSAAQHDKEHPHVFDANGDGTIDARDYDLADGRVDNPELFTVEEFRIVNTTVC